MFYLATVFTVRAAIQTEDPIFMTGKGYRLVQYVRRGELDVISHAIEALVSGTPDGYMEESKCGVVTLLFRYSTALSDQQFIQAIMSEECAWIFDGAAIRQRVR